LFIQKFLFHILFKRSPTKYCVPRYSSFIKELCSTYSIKLVQLNLFLDAFFLFHADVRFLFSGILVFVPESFLKNFIIPNHENHITP
jgi:hypothetical protein